MPNCRGGDWPQRGEDRENTLKKGSFYLTNKEKALLDAVTTAFQKVVLVLNIGSIMDFAEIDAYGDQDQRHFAGLAAGHGKR